MLALATSAETTTDHETTESKDRYPSDVHLPAQRRQGRATTIGHGADGFDLSYSLASSPAIINASFRRSVVGCGLLA